MKISVVTVCRNSEATIAGTIRSFLSQIHPQKEMLIIDGASTDRTPDIVNSFSAPQLRFLSQPDHGIFDAMNKGLDLYSGDAVGFLNSSDRFHDTHSLARIAAAMTAVEAVHGGVLMVKDHETKRMVRIWKGTPFQRGQFRYGWMPPHPSFYVRRSLAERVGKFDLRYEIAADYDYMLRALELHAASSTYIRDPLVDFVVGGASSGSFRKVLKSNVECLTSRRTHLGAPLIDLAFFLKPGAKAFLQHAIFENVRRIIARPY